MKDVHLQEFIKLIFFSNNMQHAGDLPSTISNFFITT